MQGILCGDRFADGRPHHHALCSQRVGGRVAKLRVGSKTSAAVSEGSRLWLRAGARFPRLSTARLRPLETVSRRRMQRPVRDGRRPVRATTRTPSSPTCFQLCSYSPDLNPIEQLFAKLKDDPQVSRGPHQGRSLGHLRSSARRVPRNRVSELSRPLRLRVHPNRIRSSSQGGARQDVASTHRYPPNAPTYASRRAFMNARSAMSLQSRINSRNRW